MYGAIRLVLYAGGGIAIVYALVNLFGNFVNSLIGIAVALVLFYISRFVEPPQAEEPPPPELDMTTNYRKEMIKARKQARQQMVEGDDSQQPEGERASTQEKQG